jgi:hypothetical protein
MKDSSGFFVIVWNKVQKKIEIFLRNCGCFTDLLGFLNGFSKLELENLAVLPLFQP